MRRTRTLTIAIEQRKLTIYLTRSAGPKTPDTPASANKGSQREPPWKPPLCPHCGAPWIEVTALTVDADSSSASAIYRALQQLGLHLHASTAGQLRICSKSLEEISTEETKESH